MESPLGFVETPYEIADFMVRLATVGKAASVLDTGFGRGVFLRALLNQGYEQVTGIELDTRYYEFCKRLYGQKAKLTHGDFLTTEFLMPFQLIIGNPPYIHYNRIPSSLQASAACLMGTREGDLYYAFIRRAVELLVPGGELIYIVPYHFLYNTHAKFLRSFILSHAQIEVIIDLDEARLFHLESPETVILRLRRRPCEKALRIQSLCILRRRGVSTAEIAQSAWEALQSRQSNLLFEYREIAPFTQPERWSPRLSRTPTSAKVRLGDIAKVGVGLVSGFDEVFLVASSDFDRYSFCERCGKTQNCPFLQPFAKAQHCEPYRLTGRSWYLLIPDEISTDQELVETCPGWSRKLLSYKSKMQNRYLPRGKQWFHWQALRNYAFLRENIAKKRLYVPTLDRRPYNRFAVEEEGIWPAGDVLFIQPYDENDAYVLSGYLNSEAFRESYLELGYKRGGRVVFTQRLLESCPLPPSWRELGRIALQNAERGGVTASPAQTGPANLGAS